jgi:PAS domain S-box-containing protein
MARKNQSPKWSELLSPELEAALASSATAQELLLGLTRALFPGGQDLGEPERVTWPEGQASDAAPMSTEARLRAAEARFKTLVEQIPAVTFMAVLGEGMNEIYVSPHIEALLGFTQQEWLEDPFLWYWRLHPDDRQMWNAEFTRGCQTAGPFRAECRFLARDGHAVWVHGEARVVHDAQGRPQFLQGVAFDITDIKRAQDVLVSEAVRHAKLEEELAIARRVQTSIVPQTFAVPGLDLAARMKPAEQVGGDYYDVIPFPGGCWLAIGDVSGHGLDSGLVMLMLQSALSGVITARPDASPSELLSCVNQVLHDNIRNRLGQDHHITFSLLRYSDDGRVIATGAHEDIIVLRRSGGVESYRPPGTWIGVSRDIHSALQDITLQLGEGDTLVLYTDGITEAQDTTRELFDFKRLLRCVERVNGGSAQEVCDHVFREVHAWMAEQRDDMTVLVARRLTSAENITL